MKGYWKQEELTRKIVKNGYLYTNDEGYIDEQGNIYVLGRKDDIINYRGIKIAPEEIEDIVKKYPGIKDCACVGKNDEMAGQIPCLYLVADEETLDQMQFKEYMNQHIEENRSPKHLFFTKEIPRTYNGKIQRAKLRGED